MRREFLQPLVQAGCSQLYDPIVRGEFKTQAIVVDCYAQTWRTRVKTKHCPQFIMA
jgi:hypothetical protein